MKVSTELRLNTFPPRSANDKKKKPEAPKRKHGITT